MLPQNKWHVNCQDPPDEHGVCDNWWVESSSNDSYALFKLDDMEHNFYGLTKTIFSNGWTTGEDLFRGSDDCHGLLNPISHLFPQKYRVGDGTVNTSFPTVSIGKLFPSVNALTLEAQCFSNLRTCYWNQTNDLYPQNGLELDNVKSPGCYFAWPNLCHNGQGFVVQDSSISYIDVSKLGSSFDAGFQTDTLFQNIRSGAGVANVIQSFSSDQGNEPFFNSSLSIFDNYPVASYNAGNTIRRTESIVAFNALYDILNTPFDALQAQANKMDRKKCKEFPSNGLSPGWGGAGYHVHDQGCNMWPASYLGAGLYFNTELCGPLP